MATKICLDAGHYGKSNRSPAVPAYYESDMNWKLQNKLKAALEQYGIEVITTRTSQGIDKGLKERGSCAKGCDLFISIHSNAVGSSANESVDYPLAVVPISGKGDEIGRKLADCVRETMATKQAANVWSKKSDSGKDWYGVINGATSVGVVGLILEHSFHTNTRSTTWLLDDSNLDKLAAAEAKVIAEHFGVKMNTQVYTIDAAAEYSDKAKADDVAAKLRAAGFSVTVKERTEEIKAEPAPVPTPAPVTKSLDEIAREVINGNYGNGHATREANLKAAGMLEHYTYQQIRNRVNELLK